MIGVDMRGLVLRRRGRRPVSPFENAHFVYVVGAFLYETVLKYHDENV
jgi:hypothetical protein